MQTITSRKQIDPRLNQLAIISGAQTDSGKLSSDFWSLLDQEILSHKVKFPILEYAALALNKTLSSDQIGDLFERLAAAKREACYPIIGKLIQLRLKREIAAPFSQAIDHIIEADVWYACDIISERVFGEGLLENFEASYQQLLEMGSHQNMWIQRSIGISTHYATKKKLPKHQVEKLLFLMLDHGHKTQLYIKKGIGWPAKTIAKFHPDLIYKNEQRIKKTKLSKWFQNKINIGLSMAKQPPISYE